MQCSTYVVELPWPAGRFTALVLSPSRKPGDMDEAPQNWRSGHVAVLCHGPTPFQRTGENCGWISLV